MGEVAAEAVEPLGHEHVAPPQGAQAAIETKPVVAEVVAEAPGWDGLGDLGTQATTLPTTSQRWDIETLPAAKPLLEAVAVLRGDATARPNGPAGARSPHRAGPPHSVLFQFGLREPRSFVRFEVFDHQAHVLLRRRHGDLGKRSVRRLGVAWRCAAAGVP